MRLDRFAAYLPVGQIGAVTFALSPSLRGATRRSNPAFFVAATKLDCFATLGLPAIASIEPCAILCRSIHLQHCPGFRFAASGLRAVYARCICMHEKEFSALNFLCVGLSALSP